jgi:hypothetical protein
LDGSSSLAVPLVPLVTLVLLVAAVIVVSARARNQPSA